MNNHYMLLPIDSWKACHLFRWYANIELTEFLESDSLGKVIITMMGINNNDNNNNNNKY